MTEDTALKILIEQAQKRIENIFGECGSWVKANERLPERDAKYFCRSYSGIYSYIWKSEIKNRHQWLDESNNNSAKINFAFKELFEYAENE